MFEIKLKQGGVEKTFSKDYVNIEDNLLALEHQVRQTALYDNKKDILNPSKHRTLNEAYLKMFVEMYGNQFSVDDLKQADLSTIHILNDLYVSALGGKTEDSEEKKEK